MSHDNEHAALFAFDNSYARLPDRFFERCYPTPVAAPHLIALNSPLARSLGLDPAQLQSTRGVQVLSGNAIAKGSDPIATAYSGHQFGGFSPVLGDGRAILLGEVVDTGGQRFDVQLKGAGPTRFSRRGDGRLALGPALREYLLSEAFAALGIPTTRSLAVVASGDIVLRETPLPGAVLTRVATSHIRVGTFQYFASQGDIDGLRALVDHVIARHYPDANQAPNPTRALLDAVIDRQAELVAKWMLVGFIHGVMNTDNTSIAGETIDYGPCAFMDGFNAAQVYSYIDQQGRYSYGNQPIIAQWNLARFAETLVPLLGTTKDAGIAEAQAAINAYAGKFDAAYAAGLRRKLGLVTSRDGDLELGQDLLALMAASQADFTLSFRWLADVLDGEDGAARFLNLFNEPSHIKAWTKQWQLRLALDDASPAQQQPMMRGANPAFIARNHSVEEVIAAAVNHGDFQPFARLALVLADPYSDQPGQEAYMNPPRLEEIVPNTFCGT